MLRCWTSVLHISALVLALPGLVWLSAGVDAQERPKVEIVPLIAHAGIVNAAAFSRDGAFVLTASDDGTLKLWDIAGARLVRTFAGHKGKVTDVAFSPDGARALSGGEDRTIRLWEIATGRLVRTIYAHLDAFSHEVSSVAFSPDGKRLLSGSLGEDAAKLWDAETGRLVRVFQHAKGSLRAGVTSAVFSPDGARVATGGNGNKIVNLWDTETGRLVQAFGEAPPAFLYRVKLAFSSDGARILAGDNTSLKVWDTAKGTLIHTLGSGGLGNDGRAFVAFTTDGTLAATNEYDSGLKFWSVETGQLARTFKPQSGRFVATSPDGTRTLSDESFGKTLKLWDVASEQHIRTFEGHSSSVTSVAASPDGAHFITAGGGVTLWEAASGRLERTIEDWGHRSAVFSPDGARLLTGGSGSLRLWDVGSGQLVRSLETQSADQVAFSADGSRLLSASRDGAVAQWEAGSGRPVQGFEVKPKKDKSYVELLAFSPDGTWLFCKDGYEEPLKLWNAETRQVTHTFAARPTNFVQSAAFFPQGGRMALGHFNGALTLWEAASGRLIRTFWHAKSVDAAAFSRDGSKLLSGSADTTVKLWDTATGKLIRTFEGHSSPVRSVAFSADEKRVISGSNDTTARIWDAVTGDQLVLLVTANEDDWLAITPEGFFDASPKGAQMLTVVRGLEVYSIEQFYQALYRPDLVREKLAGDPNGRVRDAAARLDLAKLVDSGRVPSAVITSHKAQDFSPADLIPVEARIVDQGGGIGRAEWRINGITVGVVERAGAAGQTVSLKRAMALDPGENIIELIAYNGANLIASAPARVSITWRGAEPTVPPRLYVMAVGINAYLDSTLRLNYSVPDATSIAVALKEAGQGHYEDVIVTEVLDGEATAAGLDRAFLDLASKVRPRDVFVFFAAGHGKTVDGRYYFIPQDLRYQTNQSLVQDAIGQDKLQKWFARILARKAVLMFDTCEAGSLTGPLKTRGGLEHKAALGRLIQATGRATLTASTATQEAYEGYGGHGVFTFALLDALARGDLNNNGLIELAELIQHVDGLVPAITEKRWGAKQFPQMDAYGSNFSLARQVPSLAPGQGDAIIIPVTPTHVNTEPLEIFKEAGGRGSPLQQLEPFTTVALVQSDRGWLLIARDGKLLGYAAEAKLHKLN
jgi:WD40 repeat protein